MKKTFLAIATAILMYSFSFAQTTISAGNVSGTWTFAGSPYLIQGAIMIPNDSSLIIEPGVTVNFQGSYKLYVQGRVLAIGAVADSITFTAADTTIGWLGIQFDNTPTTNDTSKFFYCKLQYSKTTSSSSKQGAFYLGFSKVIISNCHISNCSANTSVGGSAAIFCDGGSPIITHNLISNNTTTNIGALNAGGIYCWLSSPVISNNIISNNSSNYGGGICCDNSSPVISNNVISKNAASLSGGGGIYCNNSNAKITNNIISDNSASTGGGGGIYIYSGSPVIINNTISNNTVYNAGGGIYCEYSSPTITNNTITNNSAANGGALFFTLYSSLSLYNNILWGNTASTSGQQVYLDDENSDPDFHYCDVQGGTAAFGLNGSIFYTGTYQNNIDTIPMFVSPSAGSGTGYNGVTADWSLQLGSPCINAGKPDTTSLGLPLTDLAGNPRIGGGRIDIGAYEYLLPNSINEVIAPFLMSIYPNPATNNITIEIPQKSEIEILNINGQIIKTIYNNNTKTTIDLENLSSGVYIIKAKTDRGIAMKKFIKE
jgi:parallel beta-helix repeat protein